MRRINILIATLIVPFMLMAQPGRIGQPQMQPQIPIQRQPQMQPQRQPSATMDDQLQKLLVAEAAISNLYVWRVPSRGCWKSLTPIPHI